MAVDDPRRIDIEGAWNVRDIGGYQTSNGKRVRMRTFFRADSLHQLTGKDQQLLLGYGLRSVIDLRQSHELADFPDVFAASTAVSYHHIDVIGGKPIHYSPVVGTPADDIQMSYCAWLEQRQAQVGRVLATMAEPGALPALYHCAGGKDRTGVTTALLLEIAGVPEETIAEDYGLTARYLWERWKVDMPGLEADYNLQGWRDYQREFCPPDGMRKVLAFLKDRYGGAEGYARDAGLTDRQIEGLREALVE